MNLTDKQKQNCYNIYAGLLHYNLLFDVAKTPILIGDYFIVFRICKQFETRVKTLVEEKLFNKWNLFLKEFHGENALWGVREVVPVASMQIVFHADDTVSIDYDYFNPDYGLIYALLHGFEALYYRITNTTTDPIAIGKKLAERGIIPNPDLVENFLGG